MTHSIDDLLVRWHKDPASHPALDAQIHLLHQPHRSVIYAYARNLTVGAAVFRSSQATNPDAVCVAVQLLEARLIKPLVGVTEAGDRVGETHPRAKRSDADVEQVLSLRDAGLSYGEIAAKFDDIPGCVSKSWVRDICTGRIRGQAPVRFKSYA